MKTIRLHPSSFILFLLLFALPAAAQIPNTLLHSIPAPPVGVQSSAQFGYSVAVEAGYAVIGSPFDDMGGLDSGTVKIFNSATGQLLFVLSNPGATGNNNFGSANFGNAVAISGTRVVVGAYGDGNNANDSGKAYVYDLASATPTVPLVTLNNPDPGLFDYFGSSVAISGTWVVVGASGDDTAVNEAGKAFIYDLSSATPMVPVVTLNNPGPATSDRFGISVGISGTRVVVGADGDDTGAGDAGSAYMYDLSSATPTVPVHILNNPGPAASDRFGFSVAISGTQVVVGTYGNNSGASFAGSAYVYNLSSATPTVPVHILNNPGPAANDNFGWSVAISGVRVVVGAYLDDAGASNAGSAYVYDLGGGTPTLPVHTLNNPGPLADDQFSFSVAISGTRVVVGASLDNTGATDSGSAYLYDLSSGTPTAPMVTLNNPGTAANDNFGWSVAVSGTRMVVGSRSDDTGATNSGSAHVYDFASGTPSVPVATLNNPSPDEFDEFGFSVAMSGTRVVVGSRNDSTGAYQAGRAYVYDLASATPTVPVVTLNNPAPSVDDRFGSAVAISGTRVVVGAYGNNLGVSFAGSAYVYDLSSGTPTVPLATLDNPSPASGDFFGYSVAISGTWVVVGAYEDDPIGLAEAGSAYVYNFGSGTPSVPTVTLNNPSQSAEDRFGYAVAISGTRVVVGAYGNNSGASFAGSAYVYDVGSGTPAVSIASLDNPTPSASDQFGYSVGISGTRVIVGAVFDDTGATDSGSAYYYDLVGATPTAPVYTVNNPWPAAVDNFGRSVSIDGTTVSIGAPFDDSVMLDKGYAYVFGPVLDADNDGLLDAWELTYWPTTTGHNPLDDSDHDGYNELLELALGQNPTLPSAGGLPPLTTEDGYLTLTLTKQAGVIYEVQSAGTLLPALPDSFSAASTTVLINDATTLKVRDNFLISAAPGRFMRVKVTAAP
ncbi:MAG: hypothetical protein ABL962_06960 [Fimbriimonadaceae bacterium]